MGGWVWSGGRRVPGGSVTHICPQEGLHLGCSPYFVSQQGQGQGQPAVDAQ